MRISGTSTRTARKTRMSTSNSQAKALILDAFERNRLLALATAAHVALLLVLVPAALLDPTEILGVNRWVKPMKFAVSIAIFMATMIWLLSYLQAGRTVRRISIIIAVTMSAEMVLIGLQLLRGVQSHFNHDTILDEVIFSVMGALILVNTAAVAYAAYLFFTRPVAIGGAHLTDVRLGMILFVLASLEGGLMVAVQALAGRPLLAIN